MGLAQRLTAFGRNRLSKKREEVMSVQTRTLKIEIENELTGCEISTGGDGSMESLGSADSGRRGSGVMGEEGEIFPVRVTEYINHAACYITLDTTTNFTKIVNSKTHTVGETMIVDQTVMGDISAAGEDVCDMRALEETLAKSLKLREKMAESGNARTSVDAQLEDFVLTMDRENIYPELSYLTKPMVGKWETSLEMSDPLDPLFKACGIGYVKRFVVDKLALQIELGYSDDAQFFTLDLQIPFGNRLMKWDLTGQTYQDNDPDCGLWDGYVNIVKFELGDICPPNSKSQGILESLVEELPQGKATQIYAPTQIRQHKSIGVVHETRFSLPSKQYGKLLFLKYVLYPKNGGKTIQILRCLTPLKQETDQ